MGPSQAGRCVGLLAGATSDGAHAALAGLDKGSTIPRRVQSPDLRGLLHRHRPPQDQLGGPFSTVDRGSGVTRRLAVIVKKSSELRDCKHTSGALVRAGHDKSGVVSGAAVAAAHDRSKNARVEKGHRVQVDTDPIGATPESLVDALSHLRGGGDVVFARQTDCHPPAVSLQMSHCTPT